MTANLYRCITILAVAFCAAVLFSCATSNPNTDRVLTSISVTPVNADAQNFPNGQVTYTATGSFNLPPLSGPVTFTAPYTGSFTVDNPMDQTIATIVSTGNGTITVQCAAGAVGDVEVTASASANNAASDVVSGNAQLTCP
jgi:hypothetical protein